MSQLKIVNSINKSIDSLHRIIRERYAITHVYVLLEHCYVYGAALVDARVHGVYLNRKDAEKARDGAAKPREGYLCVLKQRVRGIKQ